MATNKVTFNFTVPTKELNKAFFNFAEALKNVSKIINEMQVSPEECDLITDCFDTVDERIAAIVLVRELKNLWICSDEQ